MVDGLVSVPPRRCRVPDKVVWRIKSPCTSSNRLPWLWPYLWRQSSTNLILCVADPSKCWRLGVCFPGEHSRLQSPLHREAFPRRVLSAGLQSQWDLIPVRGGESRSEEGRVGEEGRVCWLPVPP